MKRILVAIYDFLEDLGRSRAASVLAGQHKYEEARRLMMDK